MSSRLQSRWVKVLGGALALLGLGVLFIVSRPRERGVQFQSKTTAQWSAQVFAPQAQADQASAALREMGPAAVPDLVKLLRARDPFLQMQIRAFMRGWPTPVAKFFLPYTTRVPAAWVKRSAARSLAIIGPPARAAVPALLQALRDPDEGFEWEAAGALGRIGDDALPGLLQAMNEPKPATRRAAAYALGDMRASPAETVSVLVKALHDADPGVRTSAAGSLGRIGLPAIAQLVEMVGREQGALRQAAGDLVLQFYNDWRHVSPDIPGGVDQDPTRAARQRAIEDLGKAGQADELVLGIWVGVLRDPAPGVRLAAAEHLGQTTPIPRSALAGLARCLSDGSPEVKEAAARALGNQGAAARPVVPALTRLLEDKEQAVRDAAREALGKVPVE